MTPFQAADLLNVSVEYVGHLLNTKELADLSPATVEAYRRAVIARSNAAMDELITLSRGMNLC